MTAAKRSLRNCHAREKDKRASSEQTRALDGLAFKKLAQLSLTLLPSSGHDSYNGSFALKNAYEAEPGVTDVDSGNMLYSNSQPDRFILHDHMSGTFIGVFREQRVGRRNSTYRNIAQRGSEMSFELILSVCCCFNTHPHFNLVDENPPVSRDR